MNDREIKFILRFRNEASKVLNKFGRDLTVLSKRVRDFSVKSLRKAGVALDRFGDKALKAGKKIRQLSQNLREAGGKITVGLTAPIIAGAAAVVAAGAQYESAFAGIKKTVDETATTSFADLSKSLLDISDKIPVSASKLARLGEVAGQLGVKAPDIAKFATVLAKLEVTTNLVGEQGALQLARFLNVVQLAPAEIDKLGATVVALGNNFAVQEAELVQISKNLASFGQQIGLRAPQILAFGAAIKASGGESQAASTAFQKLSLNIKSAVISGGEDLTTFANIAGQSAEEFRKSFQDDAAVALVDFLKGLRRIDAAGGDAKKALDDVSLADVRLIRELNKVTANVGQLEAALKLADVAWEENIALDVEAAKRFTTLASRLGVLKNQITNTAVVLADVFKPVVDAIVSVLFKASSVFRDFAESMRNLNKPTKFLIATIFALVASLGPVLILLSAFGFAAAFLSTGLGLMSKALVAVTKRIIAMSAALLTNPFVAVAAGVAALIALFIVYKDEIVTVGDRTFTVMDGVLGILDTIVDRLKPITDGIIALFNGLSDVFSSVFGTIDIEFENLQDVFLTVFSFAASVTTTQMNIVVKTFQVAFLSIKTGFKIIAQILGNLGAIVKEKMEPIIEFLEPFADLFLFVFGGVGKAIVGVFTVVGKKINQFFDDTVDGLDDVNEAAGGELTGAFAKVRAGLAGLDKDLGKSNLFKGVAPIIGDSLKELADILAADPVGSFFKDAGNTAEENFQAGLRAAREGNSVGLEQDGSVINLDNIVIPEGVEEVGKKIGFKLNEGLALALDSGFETALEEAKDALVNFFETGEFNAKDFIKNLTSIFLDRALQNAIDTLFAPKTPGKAGGGLGGISGIIESLFGGGGGGAENGVTAGSTTGGGQSGIGGIISGVLSSVVSSFLSEGGMAGEGALGMMPAGTFKHAKRFQSGGLADRIPAMLNRKEAVVPTVQLPGGRGIPVAGMDGGGKGGNIGVINFQLPPDADAESFVRSSSQIQARLQREWKRSAGHNN